MPFFDILSRTRTILLLIACLYLSNSLHADNQIKVLGEYIVTNDIPLINGIKISPKKVLPLDLRDDRLCVPLKEFQDQKINISQEPSENLIGIELELYFDSEPPTD